MKFTPEREEELIQEYFIGKMYFKRGLLNECTRIFEKYLQISDGNPTLKKDNLETTKCLFYISYSYLLMGKLIKAGQRIKRAAELAEKYKEETKRVIFKMYSLYSMIFEKSKTRYKEGTLKYFEAIQQKNINNDNITEAIKAAQKAIGYGVSFGIEPIGLPFDVPRRRRWEVRAYLVLSRCCNIQGDIEGWKQNMK